MAFFRLDNDLWFPNPYDGDDDGLIAVGGDLSVNRLLLAYSNGFFPWYSFRNRQMPYWYCPLDRFVIFPNEIHISHSMKQMMRQKKYAVTFNHDFEGVIRGCAKVNNRYQEEGAWLGPEIIQAYTQLYRLGYATSVEVWEQQDSPTSQTPQKNLVGGLYGVTIQSAFFGESMFSLVPSASKLALIHLAKTLKVIGAPFIDCQFETPHLKSMGGRHIPYEQYMTMLDPTWSKDNFLETCT